MIQLAMHAGIGNPDPGVVKIKHAVAEYSSALSDCSMIQGAQLTRGFMGKRIVFCADGTWQAPVNNTNVYKLYKALTIISDQVTYYDGGVLGPPCRRPIPTTLASRIARRFDCNTRSPTRHPI
jgi:hypothetical protein